MRLFSKLERTLSTILKKNRDQTQNHPNAFGLNIFIHCSIYSNRQIYILQYNHEKSHATYTNLFPFEHNGAQFEIISGENQ